MEKYLLKKESWSHYFLMENVMIMLKKSSIDINLADLLTDPGKRIPLSNYDANVRDKF